MLGSSLEEQETGGQSKRAEEEAKREDSKQLAEEEEDDLFRVAAADQGRVSRSQVIASWQNIIRRCGKNDVSDIFTYISPF